MKDYIALVTLMKELIEKHGFWKVAAVPFIMIILWRIPEIITAIAI